MPDAGFYHPLQQFLVLSGPNYLRLFFHSISVHNKKNCPYILRGQLMDPGIETNLMRVAAVDDIAALQNPWLQLATGDFGFAFNR